MAYTTIDDPSAFFQTKLYTGTGSTLSLTNDGNSNLQPDWVWIKNRSGSNWHVLQDSSRGSGQSLFSNDTYQETNDSSTRNIQFDSNGITLSGSTSSFNDINGSSNNLVAWQWKAGGSTPTKTYKVVVVSDSGNKYRFRNSGDTATFAQSAVTLDLQEGGTYVFDWSDSSAQAHPIRFSLTSNGTHGGGSEYTTGVVKDDSAYKTTITVPSGVSTLYYYCQYHSGMGGQVNTNSTHGQTNFDGSTLSVSQPNTTAGFSIVTYTGTGSEGTIAHGLGATPKMIIWKRRDSSANWSVQGTQSAINTDRVEIVLNSTSAVSSADSRIGRQSQWNSTVFEVNTYTDQNADGGTYLAYCFAEIKGYSKFGSYTGNGNADGTFVYTGFKPAWIMAKKTSATGAWHIWDNKRDTTNPNSGRLLANTSDAEALLAGVNIDHLSNGFKYRTSDGALNGSGASYIYMAFAEHPFVSSDGVPVTAR